MASRSLSWGRDGKNSAWLHPSGANYPFYIIYSTLLSFTHRHFSTQNSAEGNFTSFRMISCSEMTPLVCNLKHGEFLIGPRQVRSFSIDSLTIMCSFVNGSDCNLMFSWFSKRTLMYVCNVWFYAERAWGKIEMFEKFLLNNEWSRFSLPLVITLISTRFSAEAFDESSSSEKRQKLLFVLRFNRLKHTFIV